MNKQITVVIVDDHEMVRRGAAGYLAAQENIQVVGEAETGSDALKLVEELVPDVVLMDLVLPEMDGIETTRKVKDISPRTQVIILTSFHEDEYIFPALQAGAISYLLKDVKAAALVEAIQLAALGEAVLHPRVAERVIREFQGGAGPKRGLYLELTEREMEILKLIARGFSNQKIADQLVITIGTVKGHVSNILGKLHLADRTQAAVFAWQEGLIQRS